nr:zinc finger, CCHC-type, retrotransposon Gag domain protein [Tanacetum cinerariifolium]
MEKIFDVMGCEDAFKTRLAVYKFEGNALAWWKAYKQAKGGDAWLVTVLSSPGVPLRATLTQFALPVDVDTQESVIELLADKKPGASGRVFTITEGHAANTS